MKHRVVITRPIPEAGIKLLRESDSFELAINSHDCVLSAQELKKFIAGASAAITLLTDKIDDGTLAAAGPELKIVANYAVGFDNIDLAAATARKVAVTNTPDVMTQTVAEHAVALMLTAARRVAEGDRFIRAGKYKQWEPELLLGPELCGKTLGIVGTGRIGTAMALICYHGFGMKIVYHDIAKNLELERATHAFQTSFNRLLEISDVVSLHVPLLPSTKHLINGRALGRMKHSAILINTSRGPIIDETTLVAALKAKKILAAGLDVFEDEPHLAAGLKGLENAVLTPHIASATHEARDAMSVMAAKNVIAALKNELPPNLVNKELEDEFN